MAAWATLTPWSIHYHSVWNNYILIVIPSEIQSCLIKFKAGNLLWPKTENASLSCRWTLHAGKGRGTPQQKYNETWLNKIVFTTNLRKLCRWFLIEDVAYSQKLPIYKQETFGWWQKPDSFMSAYILPIFLLLYSLTPHLYSNKLDLRSWELFRRISLHIFNVLSNDQLTTDIVYMQIWTSLRTWGLRLEDSDLRTPAWGLWLEELRFDQGLMSRTPCHDLLVFWKVRTWLRGLW